MKLYCHSPSNASTTNRSRRRRGGSRFSWKVAIAATSCLFFYACCMSFAQEASHVRVRRRTPMVGSYSPAEPTDPGVLEAANFAVASLADSSYSFASSNALSNTYMYSTRVVQAFKQVVTGMNYKLTILVQAMDPPEQGQRGHGPTLSCLGAFSVIVYNQFGELSVSQWGDEVSCKDAMSLMITDAGEADEVTQDAPKGDGDD